METPEYDEEEYNEMTEELDKLYTKIPKAHKKTVTEIVSLEIQLESMCNQ